MSHIGKFTVSAALLIPLALGGCRPTKGTANPEDYFPLIQVALGGGETAAMIGRNEAIKAKNFAGCVASESLISAFDSANQVLANKMGGKIVIPAVEIDVSECLPLQAASAEDTGEAGDENASVTVHSTMVAAYVAPAEEAPAEEAPAEEAATEESPAEEATEETPAEEAAPAEEPAAEETPAEEPEEEVPALKGNADVAALVETIGGMTMVVVLHYAVKLQGANCKKGTAALGAINYVNGMIKPIADEIAEPDGIVSVPAVTIDLSECTDG